MRVQNRGENTSLGDDLTPRAETLEKSRVSVIFMPKIYVYSFLHPPFRTCWVLTKDIGIAFVCVYVYNLIKAVSL